MRGKITQQHIGLGGGVLVMSARTAGAQSAERSELRAACGSAQCGVRPARRCVQPGEVRGPRGQRRQKAKAALAAGCWLLAAGCWLLAASGPPVAQMHLRFVACGLWLVACGLRLGYWLLVMRLWPVTGLGASRGSDLIAFGIPTHSQRIPTHSQRIPTHFPTHSHAFPRIPAHSHALPNTNTHTPVISG
jgi:hypothetical protein